ncbi:MAG: hypothetical protein GX804_03600, partial [Lentisphaerae bacterium]|nr:hypothetical protein [Lentisphaerota bacterium]
PSNPKFLRDREHPNGRVRFWDTESWVANSEDRVPGVLAGMLAAGHDRLVGIQGNAVVANGYNVDAVLDDGTRERRRQFNAWPVAPALAAFQHLVGNRKFGGLLWEGLPWIYKFEGNGSDDLTLVICGDISVAFDGKGRTGIVPFRTARGDKPVDGKLTIAGAQDFQLFDGNGNKISFDNNEIIVSLNDKGFYLRSDGTPGSGARLLEAVKKAKVDGYLPVAPAFRDSVKRIEDGAVFYVDLKNVLNRELSGTLVGEADGLELEYEKAVSINANGVISIPLKVISGSSSAENAYRFKMQFDALDDGVVEFEEVLHCNVISSLTPRLDGSLDDWQDALPQMVAAGGSGATMMEKAWLPMLNHETGVADGMAVAWLAADDDNFYFAARISDSTPDPGMPRFETWDEDAYFYPEEVTQYNASETTSMKLSSTRVKTGGTGAVWSSLVNKVAFTITPPDGGARLAIRFADDDNMYRRNMRLTVKNLSTGEKLSEHGVKAEMEHAWFRLNINTAVRVEVETLNWLKPQIVAVALDPVEADLKSAEMETGSGDEFSGNYGTLALFTPDGNDAASSASEYKLEWIDEISAITLKWPDGIRRYSYRMRPDLPQGSTPSHDNVQIAFNVLPDDLKPWYPMAPGTFKGYAGYWDTDYEFALNPVAEKFGGGVE